MIGSFNGFTLDDAADKLLASQHPFLDALRAALACPLGVPGALTGVYQPGDFDELRDEWE